MEAPPCFIVYHIAMVAFHHFQLGWIALLPILLSIFRTIKEPYSVVSFNLICYVDLGKFPCNRPSDPIDWTQCHSILLSHRCQISLLLHLSDRKPVFHTFSEVFDQVNETLTIMIPAQNQFPNLRSATKSLDGYLAQNTGDCVVYWEDISQRNKSIINFIPLDEWKWIVSESDVATLPGLAWRSQCVSELAGNISIEKVNRLFFKIKRF
jgi:hypothetical protein